MKKIVIAVIVLIILSILGKISSNLNPIVTYYDDVNGNGEEDWGEAVYYEYDGEIYFLD